MLHQKGKENEHSTIIDIRNFGLHRFHGGFQTGLKSQKWNLDKIFCAKCNFSMTTQQDARSTFVSLIQQVCIRVSSSPLGSSVNNDDTSECYCRLSYVMDFSLNDLKILSRAYSFNINNNMRSFIFF